MSRTTCRQCSFFSSAVAVSASCLKPLAVSRARTATRSCQWLTRVGLHDELVPPPVAFSCQLVEQGGQFLVRHLQAVNCDPGCQGLKLGEGRERRVGQE